MKEKKSDLLVSRRSVLRTLAASPALLIGAGGLAAVAGETAAAAATGQAKVGPAEPYDWESVVFGGGGFVDGFLYHPRHRGILYVRTDIGGMYRFDYATKRWIPLLDFLGHDDADLLGVLSMAVDPNDPNMIYAASGLYLFGRARKGAIQRSADQGRTWERAELPIHVGGNSGGRGAGERLLVDPNDGNTLLYGSNEDGLWKSTDRGKSFAHATSSVKTFSLVLFDAASGKPGSGSRTLYAGTYDGEGGLMVSHDGGASFQPIKGTPQQPPQHAVFGRDGALYVTFAQGHGSFGPINPSDAVEGSVWRMNPSSGDWSDITPDRPAGDNKFGYSGIDVGPDGTLAVSTLDRWKQKDDIYLSKDGGANWKALGQQAKHEISEYPWLVNYTRGKDEMGHWIADVKINPFNADELIYGTGYGLWVSRNLRAAESGGTVTFDFSVRNFEETATLDLVAPPRGARVMVAFGDVGGAGWTNVTQQPKAILFTPCYENDFSVDYAGLKPEFVARLTRNEPTHGFYSEDGGKNWTAFAATPYKPRRGFFGGGGPGAIAISARGTSMLWAPGGQPAYYSVDRGATWKQSAGWPAAERRQRLAPLSSKTRDGVYYVLDRGSMSILASSDGGANFKVVLKGIPAIEGRARALLAEAPGRARDLWLAAPSGLMRSKSEGEPMAKLPGIDTAWLVGFGAPAHRRGYPAIYLWGRVNGQEGLWRSDDEAHSWIRINDDRHQFGSMTNIAGDAHQHGVVYIAPMGRGVIAGRRATTSE